MKKKMMKAIKELNAYIDNDRQELCDELSELKLSHKRMEKLLKRIRIIFVEPPNCKFWPGRFIDSEDCCFVRGLIDRELSYPYLRRNWGYTHKQEPGHYC